MTTVQSIVINLISFMYLSGAEKPTFKKADNCYVRANCLRPETVLAAVLTSHQPWLIILLRWALTLLMRHLNFSSYADGFYGAAHNYFSWMHNDILRDRKKRECIFLKHIFVIKLEQKQQDKQQFKNSHRKRVKM